MQRTILFDKIPIKRYRLTFYCPYFNAILSGCNASCDNCGALKYNWETKVANIDQGEEYEVYIGRGTQWGNKFKIGVDGTREEVIEKYKQDVLTKPWMIHEARKYLKGKTLGCHCKPLPCHGDILVEIAEGRLGEY